MFKGNSKYEIATIYICKGNGTNIIRIFPYSAVQFATYEFVKNVRFRT